MQTFQVNGCLNMKKLIKMMLIENLLTLNQKILKEVFLKKKRKINEVVNLKFLSS